jgi:hypothetical protein
MKIILSSTLSVYTDGIRPSAIRSVHTDGSIPSVYTDRIADGLYSLFGKLQQCGDMDFFQMILPTDSNRDSRPVTSHFHRQNHRWNHQHNVFVGDSIGKSHYIPTSLTLFSSVSPSSYPSSFPSHLSPLKLQPTTHPNSPLFSTQALKFLIFLYVVTINIRSCGFYHFL